MRDRVVANHNVEVGLRYVGARVPGFWATSAATPCSSLAASCTFCKAVGAVVRVELKFCRSFRAASGSFSIIAVA